MTNCASDVSFAAPALAIVKAVNGPTTRPTAKRPLVHSRRVVILVAALGILVAEFLLLRPFVGRASRAVSHPNGWWLLLGVVAEMTSIWAAAGLQRQMIVTGGARVSMWRITALTYAANALSATLPAGSALGSGYTFRRLRSWNVGRSQAGFAIVASGVLSTGAFALLGIASAATAKTGALGPSVGLTLVAVVALAGSVWQARRRSARLVRLAERGLAWANRALRRDLDTGMTRLHELFAEFATIKPSRRDWAAGLLFAALNWLADLACLLACCRAVDARGSTLALVGATYVAGMSVSSLSLVPAGIGLVDAAMILPLAHGGVSLVSATAAVLLYRLVSILFMSALGWSIWGLEHRSAAPPALARARRQPLRPDTASDERVVESQNGLVHLARGGWAR